MIPHLLYRVHYRIAIKPHILVVTMLTSQYQDPHRCIGGDPGIGKSTLLLQVCAALSQSYNVLYITGEESLNQTKLRAERLDEDSSQLNILFELNPQRANPASIV